MLSHHDTCRKKREMYRGSEFAPRILADNDIPVVLKVFLSISLSFVASPLNLNSQSDHPVQNSRYLLYEAAQAHYYGLNPALAFTSVTSTPAAALGLGHRIGMIQEGQSFIHFDHIHFLKTLFKATM